MFILLVERSTNTVQCLNQTPEMKLKTFLHPKAGIPVLYMVFGDEIHELQAVAPRNYGSWFVNQRVSSDKQLYLSTKMDPRFLCLPYLERMAAKFSPLNQIVTTSDETSRIPLEACKNWKMEEICDINDSFGDDIIFYRYNEEKTINWLKNKVNKTAITLANQRCKRSAAQNTSFASQFNSTAQAINTKNEDISLISIEPSAEDMKGALQLVCDYLTDNTASKLVNILGYNLDDLKHEKNKDNQPEKRKADWEIDLEVEKETSGFMQTQPKINKTSNDVSSNSSKKKPTPAPVKKPVAGVKSITSFFGKK